MVNGNAARRARDGRRADPGRWRGYGRWSWVRPRASLWDFGYGLAARADGGYLVAGGHAYPASSCPRQPIVWALSADGEVEWAHRVETCGAMSIVRGPLPGGHIGDRALVRGAAYRDGDGSNGNIDARWLQAFDLAPPP